MLWVSPILLMIVLLGTQIYKRNCQTNYKFDRSNALDFCYHLETDLILGLVSLRKSIGFQFEQNVTTDIFKQQNKFAPKYMDEMFTSADQCKIKTRLSSNKLIQPHCNRESGYKAISYLGPKLWNNLPLDTKTSINPNSFKHKVNMHLRRLPGRMMIVSYTTN